MEGTDPKLRNQIKKLRQKYLDVLRLEQQQAAGQASPLNTEQQAKLAKKTEFAQQLESLGCALPQLPQDSVPAAGAALLGLAAGGSTGGGDAGGELRVRPCEAGPYASVIPRTAILDALTGVRPFDANRMTVMGPGEQAAAASLLGRRSFPVKVQVPLNQAYSQSEMPLLMYSQSRAFQCYVQESSSPDARRLAQLVRTQGVRGQKGYFCAWLDGDDVVLSDTLLPAQYW